MNEEKVIQIIHKQDIFTFVITDVISISCKLSYIYICVLNYATEGEGWGDDTEYSTTVHNLHTVVI